MDLQSEQDELNRCRAGDGEAFARIVSRYQQQVARRMRFFARSAQVVDELVQETFVEAYYSLPKYRATGTFAAWLSRIATRVGYRYWKRRDRAREATRDAGWWKAIGRPEVEQLDPARAADLVHDVLTQLPPRDRIVLLLLYLEGHSIEEAAQLLGWSQTMVKVQSFRARKKLHKILADSGIDSFAAAVISTEPTSGCSSPAP